MNYIVFDLEWNQGYPGKEEANTALPFEIIEIGAVKLNNDLVPIDSFHRIIKPVIYPVLFPHTKKIISLTDNELKNGSTFKKSCKEFISWCRKNTDTYAFATWGTLDVYELQRNMAFYKIPNRFPRPIYYYDVQNLFNISRGQSSGLTVSLENAASIAGIPATIPFHSAINDAVYTAEILKNIDPELITKYPAVDIYKFPIYTEQEVKLYYPDHSLYISRSYKTKEALKTASDLSTLYCNICHKKANRLIPWYSSNSKTYYAVGKCSKHGFIKGKRAIKSPDETHFFEVTTVRGMAKENAVKMIADYKTRRRKSSPK